ncbi:hypothetical protein VNO78_28851 [Psophocarpus tetragonolobus]|uniref:Uncharacterized protein n=1 Tax=Psophocarpus tetragonolobus TaxID=3891 RepID=A0AAN9RU12_PSOTE
MDNSIATPLVLLSNLSLIPSQLKGVEVLQCRLLKDQSGGLIKKIYSHLFASSSHRHHYTVTPPRNRDSGIITLFHTNTSTSKCSTPFECPLNKRKQNHNNGDDDFERHPFIPEIMEGDLPNNWKPLTLERYDGTTNPSAHIYEYLLQLNLNSASDDVLCQVLAISRQAANNPSQEFKHRHQLDKSFNKKHEREPRYDQYTPVNVARVRIMKQARRVYLHTLPLPGQSFAKSKLSTTHKEREGMTNTIARPVLVEATNTGAMSNDLLKDA